MNYLDLCVRTRSESGASGAGPSSVIDQAGILLSITQWVDQAWTDIQLMRPNWLFMNKTFSFDTDIDVRDYLAADKAITDLKLWDRESFLIYDPDIGETDQNALGFLPYASWRQKNRVQMNARASDRPQLFTVLPDRRIRFEPQPDKVYRIEGEYKRSTQVLAADADVPTDLPDDFHMIIVWQALKYYAFDKNAPEKLDEAETNFDNLLFRLENEQLPEMSEDFETLA